MKYPHIGLGLCLGLLGCEVPLDYGPQTVERLEFVWKDGSRSTPAVGGEPELDHRSLRVLIWLPSAGPKPAAERPLLLLSHGWGGSIDLYDEFARIVAQEDIVVAAVEYPCTNRNFEGGHEGGIVDYAEQPADYHFILDRLIEAVDAPGHDLHQVFSPERIAGLGHSLGGATLIRATRQACCADGRVAATVFLSPATFVNEVLMEDPVIMPDGPPVLVAHGMNDTVMAPEESTALIEAVDGPTHLVMIAGADHSSALETESGDASLALEGFARLVIAFIDEHLRSQSGRLAEELIEQEALGNTVEAHP